MALRLAETHELIAERLREEGQFYTGGRQDLVELLVRAGRPTTVAELLDLSPSLTQSSMYRNMADLEGVGVVRRVVGCDEPSRYELSVEIIGHHHHMICTECGVVEDFRLAGVAESGLELALVDALDGTGFRASSHRVDVWGTCAGCEVGADVSAV